MAIIQRLLMVMSITALSACTTIEVGSDFDPSVDFSGFRTYAWIPGPQKRTGDPRIDNPLLDKRIRRAVVAQLTAKGYTQKTSGTPDLWVAYHAAVERKMDVRTMNTYYGYGRGWGWDYGYRQGPAYSWPETHVYHYDEGSLILDIVDPATRQLIWRGSAQAEVNRSTTAEKRDQRLNEAVRRILEQFPPQPK